MKTIIWQLIEKEKNPYTFQLTLETNKNESIEEIARRLEKSFKDIEEILEAKIVVVKGWSEE